MKSRSRHFWRLFFLLNLASALIGCREELYKKLPEQEGNEMMALLLNNDIDSEKIYDDRSATVSLSVPRSEVGRAISLLKDHGYPKPKFTNLGEVFSKESLISSPIEEHARYTYALSQDIAKTLSSLDGVVSARVHVVLPQKSGRKQQEEPSAAVFIKHAPGLDLETFTPQIKMLVQSSVEGLKFEAVSVALFSAIPAEKLGAAMTAPKKIESVLGIDVSEDSVSALRGVLIFSLLFVVFAGLAMLGMVKRLGQPTELVTKAKQG